MEMRAVGGGGAGTAGEMLQETFRCYHNAKQVGGAELNQAAAGPQTPSRESRNTRPEARHHGGDVTP
jgi:hypothetical protein